MLVKLELANGNCEMFEVENYIVGKKIDMHPMICRVDVFSNDKKIKTRKRFCIWWYKLITFKSKKVQDKLLKLNEVKTDESKDN